VNPYIRYRDIWPQEVEASLYPTVQGIFRCLLEPYAWLTSHECDRQTDGQTDRLAHSICRAALRLAVMNAAAHVVTDSPIYCATHCTGWTFPNGCSISRVQRFHLSAAQAPRYMTDCCICTSDIVRRQHLRSAGCRQLFVPRHRRSMFGRRAFSLTDPVAWNSLPDYLREIVI